VSLRNILNAAAAIAVAVNHSGRVYNHLIWAVDDKEMKDRFTDNTGLLNTIMITRESTRSEDEGPNSNYDYHTIVLRWYRSMSRAADDSVNSEDTFQDDVEQMRLAFNANRKFTINGTKNAVWAGAMQARLVAPVTFNAVLCNYTELTMQVKDGPNSTTSL